MFNDLNQNNKPAAVDDIFAETDQAKSDQNVEPANNPDVSLPNKGIKLNESGNVGSVNNNVASTSAKGVGEIAAQKVGLASGANLTEELEKDDGGNRWFKIILIFIVVTIVLLSAYLLYDKFLKKRTPAVVNNSAVTSSIKKTQKTTTSSVKTVQQAKLSTANQQSTTSNSNAKSVVIPLIPGVNTATSSLLATSTANTTPESLVDSDLDGLTNVQEKMYGTNPQAVDTDGDHLSDYEEIKIYHTDPLNPDTDADGFSDGQEVKAGYNPLGAGKLSTNNLPLK